MTPKQRVQQRFPGSYSAFVPGLPHWAIYAPNHATLAHGSTAAKAWAAAYGTWRYRMPPRA